MNLKRLYVSLDSLFDIRQGVLNTINTEFATEVTKKPEYFLRQEDIFGIGNNVLTKENYNLVLEQMKSVVLRNSFRSKMHLFINHLRSSIIQMSIQNVIPISNEIDVNIYPFTLSENESGMIIDGISRALGKTLKVNLVNLSPDDLKLDIARNNYSSMIMYHYYDWLNKYTEQIKKEKLRDINLYVPRLFFKEIPEEEAKKLKDKGQDPFEMSQKILSPYMNIEYLPIALYCVDTPDNKLIYSFDGMIPTS